jgi:hypothetical protein
MADRNLLTSAARGACVVAALLAAALGAAPAAAATACSRAAVARIVHLGRFAAAGGC